MHRKIGLFMLLACTFLGLGLLATPAQAAGAKCWSDPTSGPPGTSFYIWCSGFSPNIHVNVYVVEPDGRAVSAAQITGFTSNVGGASILTDLAGNAAFWWHSAGGGNQGFAHQIGTWTWVVHELGPGNTVVAQGTTSVTIESVAAPLSGAKLYASTSDWMTWSFTGSGFARDETVNVWVSLPANCSGRLNVEAALADEPAIQGLFDGFVGPSNVKADEGGNIAFTIVFSSRACRGFYTVSARALGSGAGAEVTIEVRGGSVAESVGASLTVVPDSVDALNSNITLLGSGFGASTVVNCWATRPDGRTFKVGDVKTDAGGSFALTAHASGMDSFAPYASEEPGWWAATCRAPSNGTTAIARFLVYGLTSDP